MATVPTPAPSNEVSILVDVVCPDRLARQGFAVAPFPIRVPAVALLSLSSLFGALKLGALADETESLEAKEEKAEVLHKRKLEEIRGLGLPPDRDPLGHCPGQCIGGDSCASRMGKAGPGVSPSGTTGSLHDSPSGAAGSAFHDLQPASPSRSHAPDGSLVEGPSLAPPQHMEQEMTGANLMMGLAGADTSAHLSPATPAVALATALSTVPGGVIREAPGGVGSLGAGGPGPLASHAAVGTGAPPPGSIGNGAPAGPGLPPHPLVTIEDATRLAEQAKKPAVSRKRLHKVHGPAFCKMFQMLRIRFIPQGSATTLRDNSHIVMGYAAKGEEFGRLSNKAATVKMKDVPWNEPGFMGLLAAAGGVSLATVKLPERAQRVFARMMSSESMRVALMWHCAEACSRLCTFGSVYKDKRGLPFDSLVKAFIEEFRLPPKGFPESEEAALAALRLPSLHGPPLPTPPPPPVNAEEPRVV